MLNIKLLMLFVIFGNNAKLQKNMLCMTVSQ